jgi:hypothetical protein
MNNYSDKINLERELIKFINLSVKSNIELSGLNEKELNFWISNTILNKETATILIEISREFGFIKVESNLLKDIDYSDNLLKETIQRISKTLTN